MPRAHHETVVPWRGLILREEAVPLALLAKVSKADTGLTNAGIVEGQGFGTLWKCQYDVDRVDLWESYVPATMEGALAQVCWTWQSWFAELHSTWFRGGN